MKGLLISFGPKWFFVEDSKIRELSFAGRAICVTLFGLTVSFVSITRRQAPANKPRASQLELRFRVKLDAWAREMERGARLEGATSVLAAQLLELVRQEVKGETPYGDGHPS